MCGVRRWFRLDGSAIPSPHRASVEQNVLQFSQGNRSRVHVIQPQCTHFDRYAAKYADRIARRRSIGESSDSRIGQKKLLHFPTIILGNPVMAGNVHKPRCNFGALGRLQHHYPAGPGIDLIHHSTSILSCVRFGVHQCVPLPSRAARAVTQFVGHRLLRRPGARDLLDFILPKNASPALHRISVFVRIPGINRTWQTWSVATE